MSQRPALPSWQCTQSRLQLFTVAAADPRPARQPGLAGALAAIPTEQSRLHLSTAHAQENLEIRRGPRGAFVPGLTTVPVTHAEEVMSVLAKGNEERSVASTKMNAESSRSHSMLVVNITMHRRDANGQVRTIQYHVARSVCVRSPWALEDRCVCRSKRLLLS